MSKRHSEEYYKHGSSYHQSTHQEYQYHHDDAKKTKYFESESTSRKSTCSSDDGEENTSKTKIETKKKFKSGIQIKLGPPKSATESKPKIPVASVFNQESDEEPEEMPKEARMKMRNIGRDTPTSAGPNSFGKTKQGFCHTKRVFEKSVEQALENLKDT